MPPRSRVLLALAAVVAGVFGAASPVTAQPAPPPTVVLISIDAFRWDYLLRPAAKHLQAIAARGVRAERLVPAFPSKTFPNHYSIVTGLYPEHHGVTANAMEDPALGHFGTGGSPSTRDARWWLGEPLWTTAEKQHVRAAVDEWPGAEAPEGGVYASWHLAFDTATTTSDHVKRVLGWLALPADSAPRFIASYYPEVDFAGHYFGPMSAEVDSAVARVDSAVGAIVDGIARLGLTNRVDLIVVSDHGMAPVSMSRVVYLDDYVSLDSLTVIDWTPVAAIVPKPGREDYVYTHLRGADPHLAVYRRSEVPARFHFNASPHITPIVAIAEEGWNISSHARMQHPPKTANGGNHGYDNQLLSMGALFVAAGPAFKSGVVVPAFQNVHVYDLIAHILQLKPAPNDGSLDSVKVMLRKSVSGAGAKGRT